MAKHWKSFVKKEKVPEEENGAHPAITSLFSKDGKKSDKSLDDAAEFNSNLKSLIEEQKRLENQMAELTGKKKSGTDKRYDHNIKSIDQKKREEVAAEEKRRKRKESHRKKQDDRWEVTPSFNKKRKESTSDLFERKRAPKAEVNIPEVRRKEKTKLPEVKRRPETKIVAERKKPVERPPKKRDKTTLQGVEKHKVTESIQPRKETIATLPNPSNIGKEKHDLFVNQRSRKKEKPRKKSAVKKESQSVDSFVNKGAKKKETPTIASVTKKVSEGVKTIEKVSQNVSNVTDTFGTVQKKGNELQTGLEKISSVVKSPELQSLTKKVSKGMDVVNKVGKKLSKVDQLFNTANKHLEKTKSVAQLFEKKEKAVDVILGKDTLTKKGFDFDFIQKQQTKKEETQSFHVLGRKMNIDFDTIKNIKKDVDTLKNLKKQKDSFAI